MMKYNQIKTHDGGWTETSFKKAKSQCVFCSEDMEKATTAVCVSFSIIYLTCECVALKTNSFMWRSTPDFYLH